MTALYVCRIACETPFGYTLFIRTVGKNYNYFQFIFAQYKTVHISLRSRSSGRVKARRPD